MIIPAVRVNVYLKDVKLLRRIKGNLVNGIEKL